MKFYIFSYCFVSVAVFIHSEKVRTLDGVYEAERADARISGGNEVESDTEYPYQAQITVGGMSFCSGVIITDNHVLTAAHCVDYDINPSSIEVRVGSRFRGKGSTVAVAEVVMHPEYDDPQNNCDVAYIRTSFPILFLNDAIQRAVLAIGDLPKDVTVTGWGMSEKRSPLEEVDLTVVGNTHCQMTYMVGITKNMFCAQDDRDYYKGPCKGDGGAPASDADNHTRVFGLASFSDGCGEGMAPSVFVYLQSEAVRDFIVTGTGVEYEDVS